MLRALFAQIDNMDDKTVLILIGICLVTVITLGLLREHRHKWHVRAVDHGVMSEPRRNATAILYVCTICGEAKTTTVAGTYELKDLTWPSATASDVTSSAIAEMKWLPSDRAFAKSMKVQL